MVYQIYIDSLFIINCCIYFLLLNLVSILKAGKIKRIRLVLAALSGALLSCAALLLAANFRMPLWITSVMTYGLPATAMTAIINKSLKARLLIKDTLLLYTMSFILGGMMDFLKNNIGFFAAYEIGIWVVLCLACLCAILISSVISKLKKDREDNFFIVSIAVNKEDAQICEVKALCDSGNSLIDPYSNKSVSVVERAVLGPDCIKAKQLEGYRLIPFRSVGKEKGFMECIKAERIRIQSNDGSEINITDVILGLYDGKLSQGNTYRMLLHPNWIKQPY